MDRFTGSKKGSLSFGGCFESGDDNTCPKADPSNFLIGRTEYNIMMYDSRAEGRKWNISFYDYSSNLGGVEVGPEYSKDCYKIKPFFVGNQGSNRMDSKIIMRFC